MATTRRSVIASAFAGLGVARSAPVSPKDNLKVTKLETFLVKPRWLFLKIHTNAGIVGLGEPILEGRARTCAEAVKEIEPYLVGKDPRRVAHHWQAIYRHAFYRGGPILTSVLSGIDQALWDIKGKALGVPVYELLGGPTRDRVRVYAHAGTPEAVKAAMAKGFTAFKTGPAKRRPVALHRDAGGGGLRRGAASPSCASWWATRWTSASTSTAPSARPRPNCSSSALEPYQPMFIEEPCQARTTTSWPRSPAARTCPSPPASASSPSGASARCWRRRPPPSSSRTSATPAASPKCGSSPAWPKPTTPPSRPHNPLGPISLAAGVQMAASIPNFLCQEQVSLGEGYLKKPFTVRNGYLDLPTGPGLGIELDENALADKIDHDWRNPESYDADDGSVVDW